MSTVKAEHVFFSPEAHFAQGPGTCGHSDGHSGCHSQHSALVI